MARLREPSAETHTHVLAAESADWVQRPHPSTAISQTHNKHSGTKPAGDTGPTKHQPIAFNAYLPVPPAHPPRCPRRATSAPAPAPAPAPAGLPPCQTPAGRACGERQRVGIASRATARPFLPTHAVYMEQLTPSTMQALTSSLVASWPAASRSRSASLYTSSMLHGPVERQLSVSCGSADGFAAR